MIRRGGTSLVELITKNAMDADEERQSLDAAEEALESGTSQLTAEQVHQLEGLMKETIIPGILEDVVGFENPATKKEAAHYLIKLLSSWAEMK